MKEVFDKLFEEEIKAKQVLENVQTAIRSLRNNCPHDEWEYEGHDGHYDYEKCKVCRETRKT